MILSQKFTIHPVGQGLFYSGTFSINSVIKFRMVFDCGTTSSGAVAQEEVNLYRDSDFIRAGVLDLLIISHFDEDHVSHIGKLLCGNIKVKRLIMPFITFQEGLFLVLKILSQSQGYNSKNEFTIKFILDPLGTLKENLDKDSEIYLIDKDDSDKPIPPSIEEINEESRAFNDDEKLSFDFKGDDKTEESESSYLSSTDAKIFKVNHDSIGTLKGISGLSLMEFLFYKRSIGIGEKDFFDKIESLFYAKYGIQEPLEKQVRLNIIIEKVKEIKSFKGSGLEEIFIKAKKQIIDPIKPKPQKQHLKISDSNTTSLCLLHKNLKSISQQNVKAAINYSRITQIQKFFSPKNRVNIPWNGFIKYNHLGNISFPNVLLTSDTFLLEDVQVDPFLNHFQNYWGDFWLFQVPHHGSKKSSNKLLHSKIPCGTYNFINYGIPNREKHPDQIVIDDLVTTGHSIRLIPITQYQGLCFELYY